MFGGHKIISLCISRLNDERNYKFTEALNNAAVEKDYRLFVYNTCSDLFWNTDDEKGEISVFELIDYKVTDLLIIFDESFKDKTVIESIRKKAKKHNTPVICVGTAYDGEISFLFDYVSGFEDVVRHTIDVHNAKSFHMIAGAKGETCSEERIKCFKQVLSEYNIPVTDDMISYGDYWHFPTITALENIISGNHLPECIICVNDSTAITVCSTLRKYGIEPAKDIIVTGFDGIEQGRWTTPAITTAECSFPVAAQSIISTCEKIFSGESIEPVNYIKYVMRIEDSCGCTKPVSTTSIGEVFLRTTDRFHRYQEDERKLYEININSMTQKTIQDFSASFKNFRFADVFYNMCVFVNKDFMDFSINPENPQRMTVYDDDMLLIFRAEADYDYPVTFRRKDIVPSAEYYLHRKFPYIFCALHYLDKSCGYLCFYFSLDYENYCKIPQYVTSLNYAINNFRNLMHQQYMSKRIEEMYKTDHLTGVLTRKSFHVNLDKFMKDAEGYTIFVVAMDIDGLKYINDNFGHDDGDFAIYSSANALKCVPAKHKICARFGGDEFVLCATSDVCDDRTVKTHIEDYIAQINATSNKPYKISASVGVCSAKCADFDFYKLYNKADEKMYSEKIKKPNRRRD